MTNVHYDTWTRYQLYHHAIKIAEKVYYHIFIVDNTRFTVTTDGKQEEAMKAALQKCLIWLEKVIDTEATFAVVSNAVDIASIVSGHVAMIDADRLEEIDERIRIEQLEAEGVAKKAEREAMRIGKEAKMVGVY